MRNTIILLGISIFIGMFSTASAFEDVPTDAWYAPALDRLVENGLIDNAPHFRPSGYATRSEFVVILVRALSDFPIDASKRAPFFSDVFPEDGFFPQFQQAAHSGLLRGMGDCVGRPHCEANPYSPINRAEAAALLARAFELKEEGDVPVFEDVISGGWYESSVRAAASRCILQGDAGTKLVRPGDQMNRAEMVLMIDRARQSLRYGIDCGVGAGADSSSERSRPERRPENENPPPRTFELPLPQAPTGVPLLRFDMSAHKVRDIVLTGLTVDAAQGSLFNAKNYGLWVDHDGDGEVETPLMLGAAAKGSMVVFDQLFGGGYVVTEQSVTFEVRATISASPNSTILQLKIAENGIEAEELDGRALSGIRKDGVCIGRCQINQQTTPAEVLTILPQGNLFMTEGQTPIRPHLLLGGATTEPILRLSFRADGEAIDVTELRITSSGSLASSIDRLELLQSGSSSAFAEASMSACGGSDLLSQNPSDGSDVSTFCAFLPAGKLRIQEDARVEVSIRARLKSDAAGGISNEPIQLWLTGQAVTEHQSGSGSVKASGVGSSARIVANDGDANAEGELFIGVASAGANQNIVGTLHTTTLSAIATVENGSADANGSPIAAGIRTIGALQFRVATNNNSHNGSNDVVLDDLLFTVSATNVQFNAEGFSLSNIVDQGTGHECVPLDSSGGALAGLITGSFFVSCTGLASAPIVSGIASGGAVNLEMKGEITNPQMSSASHSFLQLSLQNFTSPRSSFGVLGSHIHYLDQDAGGSEDVYWVDLPNTEVQSTGYSL